MRVSDDEVFVTIIGLLFAGWGAISWYVRVSTPSLARYPGGWRWWLGAAPLAALAGIFAVLKTGASFDVRESVVYLVFYMVLGAAWVFWALRLNIIFGVSLRDDALERRNPAAAVLIIATVLAQAAIYAGGNVGDGPGWWIVALAALFAGGIWFLLWWLVEAALVVSERVTVGRDLPVAVRLGGYMVAAGMLCGRGVAGDWVSFANMLAEFADVWVLMPLTLAAIGVELVLRSVAAPRVAATTAPRATMIETRGATMLPAGAATLGKSVALSVLIAVAYVATAVATIASAPPLANNPAFPDAPPPATQGAG